MRLLFFLLFTVLSFAQQTRKVDFKTAQGNITINPTEKKVFGSVKYVLEVRQDVDTIKIDAQNMQFNAVEMNGKEALFINSKKQLILFEGYKKGNYTLTFTYEAHPKQTMYFNGDFSNPTISSQQVWTQGQGKNTSHWFPSFDDVNEKVIFNMNISFDKRFQVLANGVLQHEYPDKENMIWQYKMQKPMSSYLLAVAIGDFRHKVVASKSHIPIQLFIQPRDTAKFEPTYRYSKKIFDYLEKEIGFKYPWQIYKQVPIEDFLYGGMENTSCTLFTQDCVVDKIGFNDRNYVNINAHELAHQWFGDLITAQSGKHHWLQEGFATYYALLAEREVFGDDYFYHQLYRNSLQLRNASKTDTIPVMNEKASSLSFYQKGAWALHYMRETIGAKTFQKAVKAYLKKYQYQNVQTDDFLAEIKKVAPAFDTENFKKTWLEDYRFPTETANDLLSKNYFMNVLFRVQQLRKKTFAENKEGYKELLQSNIFYPVKSEIIYQMKEVPFQDKKELLLLALQTKDIKTRQAVGEFTGDIPLEFKSDYESLLDDQSYDTKEIAFMNLWKNFPDDRPKYLAKAKDWIGANDKSLRILYLTFSLQNQNEESANYAELIDYTSPKYESPVRQNAIVSALLINPKDKTVLKNLVNATTHYKWQFSKFGRDKIRELLRQANYRALFESLLPTLNENEKVQLQKLLDEKP
ncbi:M1 family metallopeptidase [Flavobacterium wongokense]|uniref:M1 family metallopeptidase n=1 Tax=Flavobacterium wongokense TaxID=2910674 RepID=UPI001F452300|nr:M1 family metallopeptidase [Flavobacterium sp. WG47]MCF6132431.1 M1 family metallopeptidase [Flavobacterium sp. WG47]